MHPDLFAGLDVSTQSCKLVVIAPDQREPLFTTLVSYDNDLPWYGTLMGVIQNLEPGVSESDPRMWIEAVETAFERLKASPVPLENIACISVSGQQHGLVALDERGALTRTRSKLWNDFSTGRECEILTEAVGGKRAMIEAVGNSQRTGFTAAKILHMFRHEPDAYRSTAVFLVVHNYINRHLTGGVTIMEPGDASGTALWNPAEGAWSQTVLRAIDPGLLKKLPEVRSARSSIGHISADLVRRFGFSSQCRIDAGCGDNMYGAVGTGNVRPGIITVSLGTSGTAATILDEPFFDPAGEIAAFNDSTGRHLSLVCVANLANGYNAFLETHGLTHEAFDRMAERMPPGCGGRLLVPWFSGERTPDLPLAAPVFLGFSLEDFQPGILARALLEGHILNLHHGFRRMPVRPREIRLTGGLSRSKAWSQAIADIFEAEVVPVRGEGAALGAAVHAAWVWGRETGRETPLEELTSRYVELDEKNRKWPDPDARAAFRRLKRLYAGLVERLIFKREDDPFQIRADMLSIEDSPASTCAPKP